MTNIYPEEKGGTGVILPLAAAMCPNLFFFTVLCCLTCLFTFCCGHIWPVLQAAASVLKYPRDRTNPVIVYDVSVSTIFAVVRLCTKPTAREPDRW